MGSYVPSTLKEQKEMLESIGLSSIDELFSHIPDELKLKSELNIPSGKSEMEVSRTMKDIASHSHIFGTIFRGAGAYSHYIPSIVKSVVSKENLSPHTHHIRLKSVREFCSLSLNIRP